MTIFVGPNATGKTNTIEAIQLLTSGMSFRRSRPQELICAGQNRAKLEGVVQGDGRYIDLACTITPNKKQFGRNGKNCKAQEVSQTLPSILFCPDDLGFVKGSASVRRRELDEFGGLVSEGYFKLLSTYTRSVEQRNRLLKEDVIDKTLLESWDMSLAIGAATLLKHRVSLFDKLSVHVKRIYEQIAEGETIQCLYKSTISHDISHYTKAQLQECIFQELQKNKESDIRRGMTQIGPHRDDISFLVDNKDSRIYCSQGQQRTIVLAWKMACVNLCEEIISTQPLLLLDDVMSELDASRRHATTSFIEQGIQAVVTTTNLAYFDKSLLDAAQVISYG